MTLKVSMVTTIKSVQDELCLENTTLFCTLGFQNDCICNCLQIGYKDKHVFIKRNNDSLPSDCVFLTRWPYSHSPKGIHYEKRLVLLRGPPIVKKIGAFV